MAGDFNDEYEDSAVGALIQQAGGSKVNRKDAKNNRGTRWSADREIDWWAVSTPYESSESESAEAKIADHKGVEIRLKIQQKDWRTGTLRRKPSFEKPENLPAKVWKDILEDIWQAQAGHEDRAELSRLLQGNQVDVNHEWTLYQRCAENLFRAAYEQGLE